ncbi:ATP-grasp domain-containing protein [Amycolatopsis minnesotensis]|uniref:ATP-grasp domain-containing protein n=1 Tax=Amycolatopsis minnesotensis TaxID=337894 RepID=A0ABN2RK81_9PSEU
MTEHDVIILIGPSSPTLTHAERLGLDCLVIDAPPNLALLPQSTTATPLDLDTLLTDPMAKPATPPQSTGTTLLGIDYWRWPAATFVDLVKALYPDRHCLGALSLTDRGQLLSAEVNHLLGAPDNPLDAVQAVVGKDFMRAALAGEPGLAIGYQLARDEPEAAEAIDRLGLPVIAKPTVGAGSLGVLKVSRREELSALRYPVLFEELLVGTQYSVEAFSVDGEHHVLSITKTMLGESGTGKEFIVYGHVLPAPLPTETEQAVADSLKSTLDTLGIVTGLTHTEVMVTADGVRPIESHTRNGGQHIVDMIRMTTGFDPIQAAVRQRAGLDVTRLLAARTRRGTAVMRHLEAEPGTVVSLRGEDLARYQRHIVDVRIGTAVGEVVCRTRYSSDQVGYVLAYAPTAEEAIAAARNAAQLVEIVVRAD